MAVENAPEGTFRFGLEKEPSMYKVISRGWLNAQNRTCLWSKEKIEPNQYYHYEIEMVPTDHTLQKGHNLAFILYGTDAEQTQRPETVTTITLNTDTLKVEVPFLK